MTSSGRLRHSATGHPLVRVAERLRQSLLAYTFNFLGIAAGAITALNLGMFALRPWAVVVYPAVLSLRGVIGGIMSGSLSTGLHTGRVLPRFRGNTRAFRLLIQEILVLTLESSVMVSVVAGLITGVDFSEFLTILSTVTATMTLGLFLMLPFTVVFSSISFKHGLDPDVTVYPAESSVADLFITVCYFFVLHLLGSGHRFGRYVLVALGFVLGIVTLYVVVRNAKNVEFTRAIKETFATLAITAVIVNVTGSSLRKIAGVIGRRREVYTAYPALIDTIGDVGSVVGSTATTKLALGTLKSSISGIRDHFGEILGSWLASLIMFVVYSFSSLAIQGMIALDSFLRFSALLLTANVLAAFSIAMLAYVLAIMTYQRGLDPDNFVIPIESSLADSITTISLLAALSLIG